MDRMAYHLPSILSRILKDRGLHQKDLAARSGIDQSHISRIVRGKKRASFETIIAIADALEVSLDALSGREKPDIFTISTNRPRTGCDRRIQLRSLFDDLGETNIAKLREIDIISIKKVILAAIKTELLDNP